MTLENRSEGEQRIGTSVDPQTEELRREYMGLNREQNMKQQE